LKQEGEGGHAKMSCKCATFQPDEGRYSCSVSGDGCMYFTPNSKKCAEEYGEGPDTDYGKCENCINFYMEGNKRCCTFEPLKEEDGEIFASKYLSNDIVCCGVFEKRKL